MLKSKTSARMLALTGATALVLGATSGSQAASPQTSNIAVTAEVAANCTITTTAAVAFGAYDPVTANASTDINTTGTLTVACTTGSSATVTLDEGSNEPGTSTAANPVRRMSDGATPTAHYLDYTLYSDSGRSTEWDATTGITYTGTGSSEPLTVYATLGGGQNVPVGNYSDTVVATITF